MSNKNSEFFKKLESANVEERWNILRECLRNTIREILIMTEDTEFDNNQGFFDLGLDSFTAVKLKNKLKIDFGNGFELESTQIFDHPSVNELCKYLTTLLSIEISIPKELNEENFSKREIDKNLNGSLDELSDEELLRQLREETEEEEKNEK